MQNSTEHLIANLPEPIRKVIVSIYEEVHYGSQWNDKDLYFALLDLHKWLRVNEYEMNLAGVGKFVRGLAKYPTSRRAHECVLDHLASKKIPKVPIPDHIKRETFEEKS